MTLSAVAIMANNVGCVCEPIGEDNAAVSREASATAGGKTVLLMAEEQRRREEDSRRSRSN